MPDSNLRHHRLQRLAVRVSLWVTGLLLVTKGAGWLVTGSVTFLGAALDSLMDLIASLVTAFGVYTSLQPADRAHRFGHGKAQAIAALTQSFLMIASAAFVFHESYGAAIDQRSVSRPEIGLSLIAAATVLLLGLVAFQRWTVRATRSLAIEAECVHFTGDLVINGAVIASLLSGQHLAWLDALLGASIGGYLVANAVGLWRRAVDELMDRELPTEVRARLLEVAQAHPDVLGVHDLRSRRSGDTTFVELHLELDGRLSLNKAHQIADDVERRLRDAEPGAQVTIHQEPSGIEDHRLDDVIE